MTKTKTTYTQHIARMMQHVALLSEKMTVTRSMIPMIIGLPINKIKKHISEYDNNTLIAINIIL